MNRTDETMQNAAIARSDTFVPEIRPAHSMPSVSWDPYEVWLTRIHQPRDSARRAAAASDIENRQVRVD